MTESGERNLFWALAAVAVAVPVALALESVLRSLVLPPEFEYLREAWGPGITPWVWGLVAVAALTDMGAYFLQLELQRRAATRWKRFEGLMVSASVAQIPGFIATFCFMLGAGLTATLAVIAVSTVGVLVLGVTLHRAG